jgi:hypothetical protein
MKRVLPFSMSAARLGQFLLVVSLCTAAYAGAADNAIV